MFDLQYSSLDTPCCKQKFAYVQIVQEYNVHRYRSSSLVFSKQTAEVTVKRAFPILPGLIERLQVKKITRSLLTLIKQCKTVFFMPPTWELELRCLMNWKDFKCSWIIKSSERWRGEQSGRCARLTDQEDLPVLSAWRIKTSQNPTGGTS